MMTPDELYAQGYSLEWQTWGVSVYRTVDGTPEPSYSAVDRVAAVQFERPLNEAEACARGWAAAEVDFVKRRLST